MKYLDNLIAWGDDLFQRHDRDHQRSDAVGVAAANILGPRPEQVPPLE